MEPQAEARGGVARFLFSPLFRGLWFRGLGFRVFSLYSASTQNQWYEQGPLEGTPNSNTLYNPYIGLAYLI